MKILKFKEVKQIKISLLSRDSSTSKIRFSEIRKSDNRFNRKVTELIIMNEWREKTRKNINHLNDIDISPPLLSVL